MKCTKVVPVSSLMTVLSGFRLEIACEDSFRGLRPSKSMTVISMLEIRQKEKSTSSSFMLLLFFLGYFSFSSR